MTDAEFRQTLAAATQTILAEMGTDSRRLPGFPTAYDVNTGWCVEWANEAVEYLADRGVKAEALWAEDDSEDALVRQCSHCVVRYQGRYYDAECPEGVDDVRDLPLYRNTGRPRGEVLAERAAVAAGPI